MTITGIKAFVLGLSIIAASELGFSAPVSVGEGSAFTPSAAQQTATATLPPAQHAADSVNWAGYVASSGRYTSVSGSWIVPSVADGSSNGADATWVGIGGVATHDLIQAGTEAVPDMNGTLYYQAWYEALPGTSHTVPLEVHPNDSVTVALTYGGNSEWIIDFRNNTTGKSFEKILQYDSSFSSAEWIEELPVSPDGPLSLDNFGELHVTSGFAIRDGTGESIAQTGATALAMHNDDGQVIAQTSALDGSGMAFTVTRTTAPTSNLALTRFGAVPVAAEDASSRQAQPQYVVIPRHHRGGWDIVIRILGSSSI